MNEDDPYNNAQAYVEATEDFCKELDLVLGKNIDYTSLKDELLSMVGERRALVAKAKNEIPDF